MKYCSNSNSFQFGACLLTSCLKKHSQLQNQHKYTNIRYENAKRKETVTKQQSSLLKPSDLQGVAQGTDRWREL